MYMEYHSQNAGLMFSQEWQNYSLHRSIDVQCTVGTTQKESSLLKCIYWIYHTILFHNIIIITVPDNLSER